MDIKSTFHLEKLPPRNKPPSQQRRKNNRKQYKTIEIFRVLGQAIRDIHPKKRRNQGWHRNRYGDDGQSIYELVQVV